MNIASIIYRRYLKSINSKTFSNSVDIYKNSVDIYKNSVDIYKNSVDIYKNSVDIYKNFVTTYNHFVEHPSYKEYCKAQETYTGNIIKRQFLGFTIDEINSFTNKNPNIINLGAKKALWKVLCFPGEFNESIISIYTRLSDEKIALIGQEEVMQLSVLDLQKIEHLSIDKIRAIGYKNLEYFDRTQISYIETHLSADKIEIIGVNNLYLLDEEKIKIIGRYEVNQSRERAYITEGPSLEQLKSIGGENLKDLSIKQINKIKNMPINQIQAIGGENLKDLSLEQIGAIAMDDEWGGLPVKKIQAIGGKNLKNLSISEIYRQSGVIAGG